MMYLVAFADGRREMHDIDPSANTASFAKPIASPVDDVEFVIVERKMIKHCGRRFICYAELGACEQVLYEANAAHALGELAGEL